MTTTGIPAHNSHLHGCNSRYRLLVRGDRTIMIEHTLGEAYTDPKVIETSGANPVLSQVLWGAPAKALDIPGAFDQHSGSMLSTCAEGVRVATTVVTAHGVGFGERIDEVWVLARGIFSRGILGIVCAAAVDGDCDVLVVLDHHVCG